MGSKSVRVALWVRLEAKPGKENEVAEFLKGGLPLVEQEAGTVTWYAINLGPGVFGIFDTFADNSGRDAHLAGRVAEALMAKAPDMLAKAPSIEKIDIIAAKIP
jgi:quinol monooxygenase YgiN